MMNKLILRDHFLSPFTDQILEKLISKGWYCFFNAYYVYNQISIAPEDQEKIIFTCPYGTFAIKNM